MRGIVELAGAVAGPAEASPDLPVQCQNHHFHGQGVDHVEALAPGVHRQAGGSLEDALLTIQSAQRAKELPLRGKNKNP